MNIYDLNLTKIREAIIADPDNQQFTDNNFMPIYQLSSHSKILIIGQAPGLKAQNSGMIWNDKSGDRLRDWLGVLRDDFYNPDLFALLPMDFYYPGKAQTGDLPPRKKFGLKWLPQILSNLIEYKLVVLIGSYAQSYFLPETKTMGLTEIVKNYRQYLPTYFPLSHPSPLNFRWRNRNPWFEEKVIPDLKIIVREILKNSAK